MLSLVTSRNSRAARVLSAVLLCCYVLLLCEEVFHRHDEAPALSAAALNDGTPHLAHGINADAPKECVICQSAVSQICTETFHADPDGISFIFRFHDNVTSPVLPRLRGVSLRAPPVAV